MSSDHPVTRTDADRIDAFQHLAWYMTPDGFSRHHSQNPADHLEELARVAVIVQQLDRWQAISIHQAVLTGATLDQIAAAMGEPAGQVVARWQHWSDGQRWLCQHYRDKGEQSPIRFDAAEHDCVAATLAEQLAQYGRDEIPPG